MLTRVLMVLAAVLALAAPVRAQEDTAAIEQVIRSQMEAFRADDVSTAWGFASPGIQSLFGTPDNFGTMVQEGYPMVWRSRDLRFLGQEPGRGDGIAQKVMVQDAAGRIHILEYQMIPGADGWKIDGVQVLEATGVAA